jgi:membrane dipeptidase
MISIVDAHLDIAYNAVMGRDPTRPAREQIELPFGIASVGLPDLRAGNVGLICATIFAQPYSERTPWGYQDAHAAHQQALRQIEWYRRQTDTGRMRPVLAAATLKEPAGPAAQSFVLLMEGADPIRSLDDVKLFFDAGVRIVGLAWKRTRYAGGTAAPGPLTPDGRKLVGELDRFGIIHDASHLADESFWNLLDATSDSVIASHSNCRAIVPGDRHLTDDMIRAIAQRGGVIGINFYDKFLLPPDEYGKRRATLGDIVRHARHICELTGSAQHVGIGTDMDGGLGRDQIPVEIQTSADLPRVADALSSAGFNDRDVNGIMGQNWLEFFGRHLPK